MEMKHKVTKLWSSCAASDLYDTILLRKIFHILDGINTYCEILNLFTCLKLHRGLFNQLIIYSPLIAVYAKSEILTGNSGLVVLSLPPFLPRSLPLS